MAPALEYPLSLMAMGVLVLFSGPHSEHEPGEFPDDADLLLTVRAGTLRHHAGDF